MSEQEDLVVEKIVGVPVKDIIIGNRFRQVYQNIDELAESIAAYGLHNPITVTPHPEQEGKFILVTGGRRLKAFKQNKSHVIPAIIKEFCAVKIVEAEENNQREPFTPFEKLTIAETIIESAPDRRGAPKKNGEEQLVEVVENKCDQLDTFIPPAMLRKGEKTRDFAIRVSGIGSVGNFERLKVVRNSGNPKLIDGVNNYAIPVDLAYNIALEPKEVQEGLLRECLKDDTGEVDKPKLREMFKIQREKKALIRAGIDPEIRSSKEDRPDGWENDYNIIYAALKFTTKKKDIDTLSRFPIKRYGQQNGLVCVSCPSIKIGYAMQLMDAWGIIYLGTVTLVKSECKPVKVDVLGSASAHIVIGQFEAGKNYVFADANLEVVEYCHTPSLHGKIYVNKYLAGTDDTLACGRMLDITSPAGSDTFGGMWTNYADKYGV